MSSVTPSNHDCEPKNAIKFQFISELRTRFGDVKYHLAFRDCLVPPTKGLRGVRRKKCDAGCAVLLAVM